VSLRAKRAFSSERTKACPELAVALSEVEGVAEWVKGESISIALKPEISTATFCGLAMTKVSLLHLVNDCLQPRNRLPENNFTPFYFFSLLFFIDLCNFPFFQPYVSHFSLFFFDVSRETFFS